MLILGRILERVHGDICARMLIAALFVIEKNGNNLNLSIRDWVEYVMVQPYYGISRSCLETQLSSMF